MALRKSPPSDTTDFTAPSPARRNAVALPNAKERWPRASRSENDGYDGAEARREYSHDTENFYHVAPDRRIERTEYEVMAQRDADLREAMVADSMDAEDTPSGHDARSFSSAGDDAAQTDAPPPAPRDSTSDEYKTSRRAAYEADTLRLFRTRLRLVCALTLVLLPLCNALHRHFTPSQYAPLLTAYLCLAAICLATFFLANRVRTLRGLRLLALFSYALFCFKASMAMSLTGDANPAFLLGSHNNIVLSLLLLPLSVWECLAIGAIALGTLAWSAWWILVPQESALYFSHLFITTLTVGWVLVIAHFQNATRRRAFNATFDLSNSATRLRDLTFRDALTGGYNRRYLENALEVEIARAMRHGRPLTVVMFDLDNFKDVNDSRGHIIGDQVLCAVWNATMRSIRGIDTAARYGGDEFALVLPEADIEAARLIVARLQDSVADELKTNFTEGTIESRVTLSIGIATALLARTISSQQLLDHADQFLYQAKRSGKNTVAS